MSEAPSSRPVLLTAAQVGGLKSIDLMAWCQANGQPHRALAQRVPGHYLLKGLDGSADIVSYTNPRVFTGRLRDADVVAPHGLVITPDGQLAFEALGARDDDHWRTLAGCLSGPDAAGQFALNRPSPQRVIDDECVFFGGHGPPGHFLGQDLSRLAQVSMLPDIAHLPIAVYDCVSARSLEFLDLYGYPAARRITIPSQGAVRFKAVWLASSPLYRLDAQQACLWPDAVWWLRSHAAHLINAHNRPRTRIALPRKAPDWRFAVNQPDIDRVLAHAGVSVLDVAALSATDAIRAISAAELIVTFGGVGGEHTMFAPPDCVIVEVAAPGWVGIFGPCAFAAVVGNPFARLVSTPASPAETAAAGLTIPEEAQRGNYNAACHFVADGAALANAIAKADVTLHQLRRS